jgi:hypothetical protein
VQGTSRKVQKCAFFAYQNVHSCERHPTPCFYLAQKMGRNGGDIFGNSEKRAPQGRFSTILHPTGFPERYKGVFFVFLTNEFRLKKLLFFGNSTPPGPENPPIRHEGEGRQAWIFHGKIRPHLGGGIPPPWGGGITPSRGEGGRGWYRFER